MTGPLGGSLFAGRHLRPEPRIAEALALHQAAPIHAMIDISDGLSSDLGHILTESGGLGAELDADADSDSSRRPRDEPAGRSLPRSSTHSTTARTSSCAWSSRPRTPAGSSPRRRARLRSVRSAQVTSTPGMRLHTGDGTIHPIEPRGFDHFCERPMT